MMKNLMSNGGPSNEEPYGPASPKIQAGPHASATTSQVAEKRRRCCCKAMRDEAGNRFAQVTTPGAEDPGVVYRSGKKQKAMDPMKANSIWSIRSKKTQKVNYCRRGDSCERGNDGSLMATLLAQTRQEEVATRSAKVMPFDLGKPPMCWKT